MTMKTPVHSGQILREDVLADLDLGVGEAASHLGISRVALSRVLHGRARISPNLAVRLEEGGVGTARAWLAMQSAYDLAAERPAAPTTCAPSTTSSDPPRIAHFVAIRRCPRRPLRPGTTFTRLRLSGRMLSR
ncbi:MAG: HigA family addiction module antitoxin [Ornithinibacter sp.]